MKVTVLTPEVANAAFPNGPQRPTCPYLVAAPDGLYAGPTWEWACTIAHAYETAGIVPLGNVVYL